MASSHAAFIWGSGGVVLPRKFTVRKPAETTVKVVKVPAEGRGGYRKYKLRIVRCRADQFGHDYEGGVEVLRESEPFPRSKGTLRSYEGRTRREYEELAEKWRVREQLGLAHDTPDAVVRDYVIENGLTNETF